MQTNKKCDIFISYRRKGGRDFARNIELALQAQGLRNIFFDYNSLQDGVFNEQILSAIGQCKDFLLVLSEGALDRCANEGDWVAKEIREARSIDCHIIPVVVNSDDFRWPDNLPEDLCFLKDVQFFKLMTDEYFDDSIRRLILRLNTASSGKQERKVETKTPDTEEPVPVYMGDPSDRIMILIGPSGVGKTMTLVRLARYLLEHGYVVRPERGFRPYPDSRYNCLCDVFENLLIGPYAADCAQKSDYLMVSIKDTEFEWLVAKRIIDVPGEALSSIPDKYPTTFSHIACSPNRKVWVVMLEPEWMSQAERDQYVKQLGHLKAQVFRAEDEVIIVYNKIDKVPNLMDASKFDIQDRIDREYPGLLELLNCRVSRLRSIFDLFANVNQESRDRIVPFTTGRFMDASNGSRFYQPSPDMYPRRLYDTLMNYL